jgi:hypothetical protein
MLRREKVAPVHAMKAYMGVEVLLHSLLTLLNFTLRPNYLCEITPFLIQ